MGLVLVALGVPAGGTGDREVGDARGRLQRVTAALEGEAERLEGLAADPRLGGPAGAIDLAGYLAAAEVRVWQLQVEASEAAWGSLADDLAA